MRGSPQRAPVSTLRSRMSAARHRACIQEMHMSNGARATNRATRQTPPPRRPYAYAFPVLAPITKCISRMRSPIDTCISRMRARSTHAFPVCHNAARCAPPQSPSASEACAGGSRVRRLAGHAMHAGNALAEWARIREMHMSNGAARTGNAYAYTSRTTSGRHHGHRSQGARRSAQYKYRYAFANARARTRRPHARRREAQPRLAVRKPFVQHCIREM